MTLDPFNQLLIEQFLFLDHWKMAAFLEEIVGEVWQNIFSFIPMDTMNKPRSKVFW
jgi:hypothetical protein